VDAPPFRFDWNLPPLSECEASFFSSSLVAPQKSKKNPQKNLFGANGSSF